jgi:hypothetical protein
VGDAVEYHENRASINTTKLQGRTVMTDQEHREVLCDKSNVELRDVDDIVQALKECCRLYPEKTVAALSPILDIVFGKIIKRIESIEIAANSLVSACKSKTDGERS